MSVLSLVESIPQCPDFFGEDVQLGLHVLLGAGYFADTSLRIE